MVSISYCVKMSGKDVSPQRRKARKENIETKSPRIVSARMR
jgi:hypothetical protein